MTYSSVLCDESQNTKGQRWQASLIEPSVDLDRTESVMRGLVSSQVIIKCINVNVSVTASCYSFSLVHACQTFLG